LKPVARNWVADRARPAFRIVAAVCSQVDLRQAIGPCGPPWRAVRGLATDQRQAGHADPALRCINRRSIGRAHALRMQPAPITSCSICRTVDRLSSVAAEAPPDGAHRPPVACSGCNLREICLFPGLNEQIQELPVPLAVNGLGHELRRPHEDGPRNS